MGTLLTDRTPEEIEEQKRKKELEEDALGALAVLLEGFVNAYRDGEVKFERCIRHIYMAVSVDNIPGLEKQKSSPQH